MVGGSTLFKVTPLLTGTLSLSHRRRRRRGGDLMVGDCFVQSNHSNF